MNASHVAGGGIGALLGALVVGLLKHFGVATVSDVDAAVIGSAALSAGVGIGHAVSEHGLTGIGAIIWKGHPPAPLVPAPGLLPPRQATSLTPPPATD